jgi:hypothetical protein
VTALALSPKKAKENQMLQSLYTPKNAQNKNGGTDSFLAYQTTVATVGPEQAERILARQLWDRQRPLRSHVVENYARQMKDGYWQPVSVIRFASLDGKLFLIDGQHRIAAVAASGSPQIFTIITQDVKSESEIGVFYASIDRGLSRTLFDQLHAIGVDDLYGWTQRKTNMIASGVKFINVNFGQLSGRDGRAGALTGRQLADAIAKYAESSEQFLEIFDNAPEWAKNGLKRRSSVAVALVTFQESQTVYGNLVSDFWEGVSLDSELKHSDPRKLAVRHITTSKMQGGNVIGRSVTPFYSSRYIANCFNAFVEGREITKTHVKDEKSPIKINGSRFTG